MWGLKVLPLKYLAQSLAHLQMFTEGNLLHLPDTVILLIYQIVSPFQKTPMSTPLPAKLWKKFLKQAFHTWSFIFHLSHSSPQNVPFFWRLSPFPTYLCHAHTHSQSRSDHLCAQAVSVLKYSNSPLPRPWPRKFTVPSKGPLFFYTFSHSPFLSPSFPWTSPVLNIQNNTCAFISLVAFFNALML